MMDLASLILPIAHQLEAGNLHLNPGKQMAGTEDPRLRQEGIPFGVGGLPLLLLASQVVLQITAGRGDLMAELLAFIANWHLMHLGFGVIQLMDGNLALFNLCAHLLAVGQ